MSYTLEQIARVNATLRLDACRIVGSPILLLRKQRVVKQHTPSTIIIAVEEKQTTTEKDEDESQESDEEAFVASESDDSDEYKDKKSARGTPKRKAAPVPRQARRTAARLAQQRMVDLCVVSESDDDEEEEQEDEVETVEQQEEEEEQEKKKKKKTPAIPLKVSQIVQNDDDSSAQLPTPKEKMNCDTCWRELVTSEQLLRCGMVHVLFTYKDLFRRAWHLWQRYFTDPRSGAHRDDSEPMRKLRGVLEDNGIAWNDRCLALALPFDRSHRASDAERQKRYSVGDSVQIHSPWIDMNVVQVLRAGFLYLVRASVTDGAKASDFFNFVVRKTLPLLCEQKARRARGVELCLAELEAEFLEAHERDTVYQFVCMNGFARAAETCTELAERQQSAATKMRGDNEIDMAVLVQTNAIGRAHAQLDEAKCEQRLCQILRSAQERSACDYAWPLEIGAPPNTYVCTMRRHKDTFVPRLERVEPVLDITASDPTDDIIDSNDEVQIVTKTHSASPNTKRRLADVSSEALAHGLARSLHDSQDTWLPVQQFFESMALSTEPMYSDNPLWDDLLDKTEAAECIQQVLRTTTTPKKSFAHAQLSPRAIDRTSVSIDDCHVKN